MEKSILLHYLTPDEFKQIIREVIREELFTKNNVENKDENVFLTREEACAMLKINKTTLGKWTKKGKLISYGIGNRRYYKKEDLLNSLVLLKAKRA
jgi:excisionase family DNA binding protein